MGGGILEVWRVKIKPESSEDAGLPIDQELQKNLIGISLLKSLCSHRYHTAPSMWSTDSSPGLVNFKDRIFF